MTKQYASGEIASVGQRLFEEKVRSLIAPADRMKYLVIEVSSGDYRIGWDENKAFEELEAAHPDGAFYFVRADGAACANHGAR